MTSVVGRRQARPAAPDAADGRAPRAPEHGSLYLGDCLDWMSGWADERVDLIYLDPPFNTGAGYDVVHGEAGLRGRRRAYEDVWAWNDAAAERVARILGDTTHPARGAIAGLSAFLGESGMLGYLASMAERLAEMRRILKPTGALYLHCDPTSSHYLKIVMDGIFGAENFRNEIVWSYRTGGVGKRHWPRKHDALLFYVKSGSYRHHPLKERVRYEKRFFGSQVDDEGRPYADVYVRDVWDDVKPVVNVSKERLGYPTQKPIALLERVVAASSAQGGMLLDPYCGSGAALVAAQRLGRRWAGVDSSPVAIEFARENLRRGAGVTPTTVAEPRAG